jgi:hypothetical protein
MLFARFSPHNHRTQQRDCFGKVATVIRITQNTRALAVPAAWIFVWCAAIPGALPASAQQRRVPHGAFLRRSVKSVPDLVRQVNSEPILGGRYSRLFRMSPQMVRMGFAKLRLERTKTDLVRKIYYVHPGEQIGYRVRRIKKGTPVFAAADGTPVLLQVCGNAVRPVSTAALSSLPHIPDFNETDDVPVQTVTSVTGSRAMRYAVPELLSVHSGDTGESGFVVDQEVASFVPATAGFYGALPSADLAAISAAQLLGWAGSAAGLTGAITGSRKPSLPPTETGGSNGGDVGGGGNNGGDNGTVLSVVPESNSLPLCAFAAAGCLAFVSVRRRFASK